MCSTKLVGEQYSGKLLVTARAQGSSLRWMDANANAKQFIFNGRQRLIH